jgi:hypothetical protein
MGSGLETAESPDLMCCEFRSSGHPFQAQHPKFFLRPKSLSIWPFAVRLFSETTLVGSPEEKMKYLCLVVIDENKIAALTPAESQALDDASIAHDQGLRDKGQLVTAQALESVRAAVTVRGKKDKPLVTDGPFAETREQIGGFLLIEANDMKEAIQIASQVPVLRFGAIEIRAIKELTSSKDKDREKRR